MASPLVDVIIPVHSATRPVARAVASIVEHTIADVRVTVVAHNIDERVIRDNLGALVDRPDVRLVNLLDGIPSPAGPLNHGLDLATASFTSVLGSDDEFQPGAIDSWLTVQERTGAAMVIARIFHEGGKGFDPYPPVRIAHIDDLDGVKDRLAYRSAPLGLVARDRFGHLRFTVGLPSGEDLSYVTYLWFSGERVAFDLDGPGYLGHHDAVDRVSHGVRTVADDFAFLDDIVDAPWFDGFSVAQKRAIVIKLLRMQLPDAILARLAEDQPESERVALADVVQRLLDLAPGVEKRLSVIDHKVIAGVRAGLPRAEMMHLLEQRWNYRSVGALTTRNPLRSLDRQAPFRTLLAGSLVMGRRRGFSAQA